MTGRPVSVVVASLNSGKIVEMGEILGSLGMQVASGFSWPEIEETASTLEGNAALKARFVAGVTGFAAIADDTGLEVSALGGAPGVRTARYAGEGATRDDNVAKLLEALDGATDRTACFRTAVALVTSDCDELVVEGRVCGRITIEPRGSGGFGYDQVFEVAGKTFAEMDSDAKNLISHRGNALRALEVAMSEKWGA